MIFVLTGSDALLSIAQMPGGIPVACVGVGRGENAALLAAQIMATGDAELERKLVIHRKGMAEEVMDGYVPIFDQVIINNYI